MRKAAIIIIFPISILIIFSSLYFDEGEDIQVATTPYNSVTNDLPAIPTRSILNTRKPQPKKDILLPDPEQVNEIGLAINQGFSTKDTNYYFSPISVYALLNEIAISSVGDTRTEVDEFTGIDNSSLLFMDDFRRTEKALWYANSLTIHNEFVDSIGLSAYEFSENNVDDLLFRVEQRTNYSPTIAARSLFAPESEVSFSTIDFFSINDYLQGAGKILSDEFILLDESRMRIDYSCVNSNFSVARDNKNRFFSIPGKTYGYNLVIVQPYNTYDTYNMLPEISYDFLQGSVSDEYEYGTICIPQGKYFSENDFIDPIIAYGIRRMFFPDVAEMDNLSDSESVFVSAIYSFSVSDFDIPGELTSRTSLPDNAIWLNSPFLYFEIDKNNSMILGIGRYHSQNWK